MLAQEQDEFRQGTTGARMKRATGAMADNFSTDATLLRGEGESGEIVHTKGRGRAVNRVEDAVADAKGDVAPPEGVGRLPGVAILTGPHKEVKGHVAKPRQALASGGAVVHELPEGVVDQPNW